MVPLTVVVQPAGSEGEPTESKFSLKTTNSGANSGGGIFGDHPSLTDLDDNYNLIHEIDFRAVYATVLRHWMDTDPEPVLGGSFEDLGFL